MSAIREILPGLFCWTTYHEPISSEVSSYYVARAEIVIDPKVPDGGFDALPGEPRQVVLTSGHHGRDATEFAQHFGIDVRASVPAAERLDIEVRPFSDGEEIAPGVTTIHIGVLCDDEGALHITTAKGDGALAFADGVTPVDGGLGFFPDELLGDDPAAVKAGLKERYATLLDRDFDHLLFAHGDPWIGGGKAALRAFVEG